MIKSKTALTFSNDVESFLSENMENNRGWQQICSKVRLESNKLRQKMKIIK